MRKLFVVPIVLVCFGLIGCGGPPEGTFSGNVNLDGKPLASGAITMVKRDDGLPVASTTIRQGSFALDAPIPTGSYTLSVSPPAEEAPAGADDSARLKELKAVPQRYWSYTTSNLFAEINEGDNPPKTFELTTK